MAAMEQAGTAGLGNNVANSNDSGTPGNSDPDSDSDGEDDIPIGELYNIVAVNFDGSAQVHPSRGTIDSKQPVGGRQFSIKSTSHSDISTSCSRGSGRI